MGNGQPALTEIEQERIRELRRKDWSYLAIAKVTSRAPVTVSRFCRNNGLAREVSPNVIRAQRERGRRQREQRPIHVCQQCGKEFRIKKSLGKWYRGQYCSRQCSDKMEKWWKRNPDKAFKGQYVEVWFKHCLMCERLFTAKKKQTKTCEKCRVNWHQIRKRDYIRNKFGLEVEYKCCKYCGKVFPTYRDNQKCCSMGCGKLYSKQQEKAKRRGAFRENVSLYQIYMRDGGRCKICGRRLSLKKRVPYLYAPVRDHIIPIALGGLHEYKNVQLVCFLCNSKKGAGYVEGGEQMRLW